MKDQSSINKPRHTPGPWRAEKTVDMGYAIWDGLNRSIAFTGNYEDMDQRPGSPNTESSRRANAQLIATSTELLEACKLALEWLDDNDPQWKPYKKVKDAIAKAEGRK